MAALGRRDRRAGVEPIESDLVIRIGKFAAGPARAGSLAAVRIGVPRRGRDLVQLGGKRIEGGILKLIEEALAEFALAQARAGHSLTRAHANTLTLVIRPSRRLRPRAPVRLPSLGTLRQDSAASSRPRVLTRVNAAALVPAVLGDGGTLAAALRFRSSGHGVLLGEQRGGGDVVPDTWTPASRTRRGMPSGRGTRV